MQLLRTLTIALPEQGLPPSLLAVLPDYRRAVNELLRFALTASRTSKAGLATQAATIARELRLNGHHGRTAAAVALGLARGHRRRVRHGLTPSVPYVRRQFLRAEGATFHFDVGTGRLRLSLRNGEWVGFDLLVPTHHRKILEASGVRLKQIFVSPTRIQIVYSREAPKLFDPASLLALDTNESSLDGVELPMTSLSEHTGTVKGHFVRARFPEVRRIQSEAFARHRRVSGLKAHDRRVAREILGRIGRRQRHRVVQRLHELSGKLVEYAFAHRAALALEDLTRPVGVRGRSPRPGWAGGHRLPYARSLRRRLSSWPRRELHRQIEYKAASRGVPLYWIDPRNTSKTCPRCGDIQGRRTRTSAMFNCTECGWRKDRQLNAGLNIARTARATRPELGGLWLDPDGLPEDVVSPLYLTAAVVGHGMSGGEGKDPERPLVKRAAS